MNLTHSLRVRQSVMIEHVLFTLTVHTRYSLSMLFFFRCEDFHAVIATQFFRLFFAPYICLIEGIGINVIFFGDLLTDLIGRETFLHQLYDLKSHFIYGEGFAR